MSMDFDDCEQKRAENRTGLEIILLSDDQMGVEAGLSYASS